MYKTLLGTLLIVFLGISMVVYSAGAEKVMFSVCDDPGPAYSNAKAFAIVNRPNGKNDLTIEIQLRDAVANETYTIKSGGTEFGSFKTNKKGHGHIHLNVENEDDMGKRLNIWTEGGVRWLYTPQILNQ